MRPEGNRTRRPADVIPEGAHASAPPRVSVVVSTYERPDALAMALDGVRRSAHDLPLEVIVADDGSGPETAAVVDRFRAAVPFPVLHARQDHRGFRLAAARNNAIRAASGEVLVFTDGDCVLEPRALRLHAARTRPGIAHTGARVFLEAGETADVLSGRTLLAEVAARGVSRERPRLLRLRVSNALHAALRFKPRPKLCAANCAIHISDLRAVNGFDERFVGWGLEDDDIARRLRRAGARIADGTLDCLAVHLFHKVHESHRPDSRGTANWIYFRSGRYLTIARRGLVERRLEDIRLEVAGEPPASAALLLAGRPPVGDTRLPPEATVVFPAPGSVSTGRRVPRGECVLVVPPEICAAGTEAIRKFLEDAL
jgi:glycosyltransferase involved in cell wall biosynthesis